MNQELIRQGFIHTICINKKKKKTSLKIALPIYNQLKKKPTNRVCYRIQSEIYKLIFPLKFKKL